MFWFDFHIFPANFSMFGEKKKAKKKGKTSREIQNDRKIKQTIETADFKSYIEILNLFNSADLVLYIIDSRNPLCCFYKPYQELLGDKFVAVLNKIDLIPRESALGWLHYFSNTSKSVAISAVQSIAPLQSIVKEFLENSNENREKRVVITGVGNVGKRTIFDKIKGMPNMVLQITKPYTWLKPSADLCIIGSSPFSTIADSKIAHSRDFIGRCSIHSIMETFGVGYFSEPDVVLKLFGDKKSTAAQEFFNKLLSGKYLFYSSVSASGVRLMEKELSDEQKNALKCSLLLDQYIEPFICLTYPQIANYKDQIGPALQYFADHKDEKL